MLSISDVFLGSLLFVIISSLFLFYSWRQLKAALDTLPMDSRRVIYNLKHITDGKIKRKAELISGLHLACILLGISIFTSAFLLVVLSPRLFCQPPSESDLAFACNLFGFNTGVLFFTGFYALTLVTLVNFIAMSKGEDSPLFYEPPPDADERIRNEYSVVFKADIGLSPELLAHEKKLKWWQRLKINWAIVLPAIFGLIIAIFKLIKYFFPDFSDLPGLICLVVVAIIALIYAFKQKKQ